MSPPVARRSNEKTPTIFLSVLELEDLLDRLAVALRRGQVDEARRVAGSRRREEPDGRARRAGDAREHAIAVSDARLHGLFDLALTLDPAVLRHEQGRVLGDDEILLRVLDFLCRDFDHRAALRLLGLAVLVEHLEQFFPDDRPASRAHVGVVAVQELADLVRTRSLGLEFVDDEVDLEFREPVQLEFEDRVGLLRIELLESLLDLRRSIGLAVGCANDLDDLVERVEDEREALEDVDPLVEPCEFVLEALRHDLEPEVEEVPQDLLQPEARWSAQTSGFSVGTRQVRL